MGRNLIVGDIHGCLDKLKSVLELAGFCDDDTLYFTGDICDRGPKPLDTLRFLMSLHSFKPVLGNHDLWLYRYLKYNELDENWIGNNGGAITVKDFETSEVLDEERKQIIRWLEAIPLIREVPGFFIAHASLPFDGLNTEARIHEWKNADWTGLGQRDLKKIIWDREYGLSAYALEADRRKDPDLDINEWMATPRLVYGKYETVMSWDTKSTIFIGHTPILEGPVISKPYHLINVDTGAFTPGGRLTLMDMGSLHFWQA
jgi:hypothetical protein